VRVFVLDTMALRRIVFRPRDLTRLGRAIVEMAQDYQAELVVPTFVLAEMELELRRLKGVRQTFHDFLAAIVERDYIRIETFGTEQVSVLPTLLGIPEMHDRIIAAHAVTNDAPLMTNDRHIRDAGLVETVW
jgi:predicted nucleic acid-binding protein